MNPRTLKPTTVATLEPPSAALYSSSEVAYDGSFFVLNPSASTLAAQTGTHPALSPSLIDRITATQR